MAKKPSPESSFGLNPFKQLKGFAVSGNDQPVKGPQAEAAKIGKAVPSQTDKANAPKSSADNPAAETEPSFVEEMRRLGVVLAPEQETLMVPAPEPPDTKAPPDDEPISEQQLFVSALGRLDTTFSDDYDLEQSPPTASPRRMKQLRQGTLQPEARLDLHGVTREEVRGRVRFFLEDAAYHKKKVALIITGWGKNSSGEPVVRQEVERYLALDAKAWVVEWGRAPRQLGGEGALVVFLKGS